MLSIIIPHYNSTQSLRRLINSIPKNNRIEIIIIDDNSDEYFKQELLQIKKEEKNRNILFFHNNKNKENAGVCRNIGLKYVSKKWVLFADADDYFMDGFINSVQKYLSTETDVVYFIPTSIEEDTKEISNRHVYFESLINNHMEKKSFDTEIQLRFLFTVPWSKLIRTKFLKENDIYFDEVIAANDVMFSTKVGYHLKEFMVSEDKIYCVTKNKGSLTMTINDAVFDSRLNVFINYYHYLKTILTKQEFKLIKSDISGRGLLIQSLKINFRKMLLVFLKLKINKIHIIDARMLNPIHFYKRLYSISISYKNEKRFQKK